MKDLLNDHKQLMEANRACAARLAESYGWQSAPDEAPSPAFQSQRRDAEAHSGSRLTKFFAAAERITTMPQPPATIIVATEARLLLLPEPLLSQVQTCEKAYAAGRWYVVTPVALWVALTRLLGAS